MAHIVLCSFVIDSEAISNLDYDKQCPMHSIQWAMAAGTFLGMVFWRLR